MTYNYVKCMHSREWQQTNYLAYRPFVSSLASLALASPVGLPTREEGLVDSAEQSEKKNDTSRKYHME